MKKNDVKKQEALKLRENGMKLLDIRDKTGLSKATLERLFKRNSLISDKLSNSHKNNETPQNKGEEGDKNVNSPIKSEVADENVKSENIDALSSTSFSGINIIFDTKTGGFRIGGAERVEEKTLGKPIKPGAAQQFKTSHVTEKPGIEAPDNVLDNFFSRGLIETLVPIGLVVAGYMMKGKKGSKNEFREQREGGGEW